MALSLLDLVASFPRLLWFLLRMLFLLTRIMYIYMYLSLVVDLGIVGRSNLGGEM